MYIFLFTMQYCMPHPFLCVYFVITNIEKATQSQAQSHRAMFQKCLGLAKKTRICVSASDVVYIRLQYTLFDDI